MPSELVRSARIEPARRHRLAHEENNAVSVTELSVILKTRWTKNSVVDKISVYWEKEMVHLTKSIAIFGLTHKLYALVVLTRKW